jgi:soluble lytic murein transglycosylase
MRRRLTSAALLWLFLALGSLAPGSPYALKTTSNTSPGSSVALSARAARVLASHGEPRLALESLRADGLADETPDRDLFAARLLAETGKPLAAESLLASRIDVGDSPRERFRTRLQRARLLLDAGQAEAALEQIAVIDTAADPLYAAYRDFVAAGAHRALGHGDEALAALERARAGAPEALRGVVDAARADAYRESGRTEAAFMAARDAASSAVEAVQRRRWLRVTFELGADLGRSEAALDAAMALFRDHRRSAEAEACAMTVMETGLHAGLSDEGLLACASCLQSRGRADGLRVALRALDERPLDAARAEELRLLWGEYHFMKGDYSRAIALARPTYDDPGLQRRSVLLMARSYKRVGREADAAATYEALAEAFPNDPLAAEAMYTAASLYESLDRATDRDRVLDALRHAYPSTFHGWAASMSRAKSLEAAGRADDAATIFEQWLTRSRRTDEATLFYLARLRQRNGDTAAADALMGELRGVNPFSFYVRPDVPAAGAALPGLAGGIDGVRIAAWLDDVEALRGEAYLRVLAAARRAESEAPAVADPARDAVERGRFFLAAGFRDWAELELDTARREGPQTAAGALALARLYEEHAMPWRSVRLYERARTGMDWTDRRALEGDFRFLTHPVPYPAQVLAAAAREQIAAHLLYGIMREESRFEADVVSRAGAVGLMQLMPATARMVARRMDLALEIDDRLGEPEVNVSLGAWYAADMLRAGKGSTPWALAAYNAGPGAAKRWIRPGDAGEAAIDAVEEIDYKETRGYVKRVTESANVYHALYFGGGDNPSVTPR